MTAHTRLPTPAFQGRRTWGGGAVGQSPPPPDFDMNRNKHLLFQKALDYSFLGWFKNPLSTQTEKLMAGTKFSDYLGLNHYKKAKQLKHFINLRLAQRPQSLSTCHSISPTVNSGHRLKKYVPMM